MSATAILLAVASVMVVAGAIRIFARDLHNDTRTGWRVAAEAAVPLLGIVALVWWSWAAR